MALATLVGALALGGCHGSRPDGRKAGTVGPVAAVRDLDPAHAPPGTQAQMARLQWERPGTWHEVDVDAPDGSRDVLLVARDPFGDRIVAARAGGHAVWRGTIACPEGRVQMVEGALFAAHAPRPTPAGPFRTISDRSAARALCGDRGRSLHGTPAEVSARIGPAFVSRPPMDAETLKRMDADAAAHRAPER